MSTFTLIHVIISLIGIFAGLILIYDFLSGKRLGFWNATYLVMTILTSVTGFFFPWKGFTPGVKLGIISLVILAIALVALKKKLAKTYIVTTVIAEFLNVLVLIAQSFQKIPPLHALAPTGKEPIVPICTALAFLLFLVLAVWAIRKKAFVLV
jgi:hypothetical protein